MMLEAKNKTGNQTAWEKFVIAFNLQNWLSWTSNKIKIAIAKKTFNDAYNYLSSLSLGSISPEDLTDKVISPLVQLGEQLKGLQQTELPDWLKTSLESLEKLVENIKKDYEDLHDNIDKIENKVRQLEQENTQYNKRLPQIEEKIVENNKMLIKLQQIKTSIEMINQPREQKDKNIFEETEKKLKAEVEKIATDAIQTVTGTMKKASETGGALLKEIDKSATKTATEIEQTFTSFFSGVFSKPTQKPRNKELDSSESSEKTTEQTPKKDDQRSNVP